MPWQASNLASYTPPILTSLTVDYIWEASTITFASGHETRIAYQTAPRRRYKVQMDGLTPEEYQDLVNLFGTCQGVLVPLKLTINGTSSYVRFAGTILSGVQRSPNSYDVTVDFIEVHPSEVIG